MKNLSKQQFLFATVCFVSTVGFLYTLQYFMANHQWKNINIIAIVYGVLMFLNGLANGYFDNDRMQRIDLAFRYHLLTFIIVNGVHCIYSIIPNSHFTIMNAALGMLFWGIGLFVHYLLSRKTIKGYTAEELFE